MSYRLYINGIEIPLSATTNIAQTKQVNDIANPSRRDSNFTYTVKIPRTAQAVKAFGFLGAPGNASSLAYQKNTCDLIDLSTGHHMIYKGWAQITEDGEKEYSVVLRDGSIDFFKAIENKYLSEVGIAVLNHSKNLDTVTASWSDPASPYLYILANYNGKLLTDASVINIDYIVPCVRTSWLWDKVMEFFGFTYSGAVFTHERFLNHFVTYPNPVTGEAPTLEEVAERASFLQVTSSTIPPSTIINTTTIEFFAPADFDPAYYSQFGGIADAGLYRFEFTDAVFEVLSFGGSLFTSRLRLTVWDSLGQVKDVLFISLAGGAFQDYLFDLGDRFVLQLAHPTQDTPIIGGEGTTIIGSTTTTFSKVTGFTINFTQAFADFRVTDFVREIMVDFGLTPFKGKYTDSIAFLTIEEILQNPNVYDLSDKVVSIGPRKYTFGNYARSNAFKYRHNDDRDKLFDGEMRISNENLPETATLHQSVFYAPESNTLETFIGTNLVYKMYDREVKDDGTVTYKDLKGRYYVMRQDFKTAPITIGSDVLADSRTITTGYPLATFYRLAYNEVIDDWQRPLLALVNKARVQTVDFWLKASDIFNFDFSRLVFLRQTGLYYIVNKINAFTQGKATKVDLIAVDYFTAPADNPIPDYSVVPGTPTIDACTISLPIQTDYPGTFAVNVRVFAGEFSVTAGAVVFNEIIPVPGIVATYSAGVVTFPATALPANLFGYRFIVEIVNAGALVYIASALSDILTLDGSCYTAPAWPTTLVVTSATDQGEDPTGLLPGVRLVAIEYDYTGIPTGANYNLKVEAFGGFGGTWFEVGTYARTEGTEGTPKSITISAFAPTKIRLTINAVTSAPRDIE